MLSSLLRRLVHWVSAPSRRGCHPSRRSVIRFRPRLEELEGRTLPATVTWTNSLGGAWETAANWSTGALPGPADDVVISDLNVSAAVTHASDITAIHSLTVSTNQGSINMTGGSLTVGSNSTINDALNVSGGTIMGPGDLTLAALFTWTGGTMSGSGRTIGNGGITIGGTGAKTLDGRTLTNQGNGNAAVTGSGPIYGNNGAVINNSGTFDVQADPTFNISGTTPTFKNFGTFRKSAGTGTTFLYFWVFNNPNGTTVDLQSGTLASFGGGSEGGNFTVAAGATLLLGGGTHAFRSTSAVTGAGTVNFQGGTVEVAGTYNITGGTSVSGATVSFPGTLTSVGNSLTISGGTADFVNNSISVGTLNLSNGGFRGVGDVAVTDLIWSGGTMADTGSTTIGGTMSISGTGQKFLDSRTLNLNGSMTSAIWSGGTFVGSNGAAINNNTLLDVQTDQQLYWSSGDTPIFLNQGTLRKSAGTGTTTVNWQFWNGNTVNVESGTLALAGGGISPVTTLPGVFTVAAGTTLRFSGGTYNLAANTSLTGAGSVDFTGSAVEEVGTYNITGATSVTGANVSFPGTVTSVGSSLTISSGTVNFENNSVSTTTGTISGGTLLGTGNIQFTFLTWTGGTMGDTGTTTVGSPGILAVNGSGQKLLDGRTLNLPSTTTDWNGGTIIGSNGAVINNGANSTFAVHTSQQLYWSSGITPVFNNANAFTKNDSGLTTISWQFNNNSSGFAEVDNGTLALAAGGTSQGNFTSPLTIGSPGSTLQFSGGTYNLAASSSISGFNAVQFTGATVEEAGTFNVNGTPASTTISGGTVNFIGTTTAIGSTLTVSGGTANFISPIGTGSVVLSTLTVSGGTLNVFGNAVTTPTFTMSGGTLLGTADVGVTNLTWSGGTMGDGGSTTVAPNGVLSIISSNQKTLDSRTLNVSSGVTGPGSPAGPIWAGGLIIGNNGAVLNNNTTFDVQTDQQLYWSSGNTPVFNNFGTFRKSATTGQTTVGWLFNNFNTNTDGTTPGGIVNLQAGTLALNTGGTNQGSDASDLSSIMVAAGTTLNFSGGDYSLGTNSSVTGAGAVVFDGASVEVGGSYNITGSTTISGGSVSYPSTVTSIGSTLTISSGTANFENNSISVVTGTFSGGTLLGKGNVGVINLTWSGTNMADTGTTAVAGTLAISGSSQKTLDSRTLTLNGSTTWTGGLIVGLNGAAIYNYNTFTIQTDQQLYWSSGATPRFYNYSTFRKSAGTGTTTVGWRLFNSGGTVDVQSGTLALANGGSSGSFIFPASFTVAPGTILAFSGDTYAIGSGSSVTGAGSVVFSGGSVEMAGTYNISGSTTVSGAAVSFPGTLTSLGSSLTLSAGALNLVNNPVTVGSGSFSGGVLLGLAELDVGILNWTGTTMADVGTTYVTSSLTISGTGAKTLDGRTLRINGSTMWSGGTIYGYNGAVITNQAGSIFIAQTDQYLYWGSGGTPVFNNFGTFRKSAGTGTTTVSWVFNNAGTTEVQSGTLSLAGGGASSGSCTIGAGANLTFSGGNYQLSSGSSVTGGGGVTVSAGTLDIFGTYNITGSTSVTGGSAEFYSNASTATLTNAGTVFIGNAVTLTVTGSYTQTSGGVTDLFAGTLTAGGGVSLGASSSFFGLGNVNGNLTNAGTLSLGFGGSTGVLNVMGNFVQSGTGTLQIKVGGTTAGTQYDQLTVTGTATLAGTLSAHFINGFSGHANLAILTAGGGRSATFGSVSLSSGTLAYDPNDVTWQF